MITARRSVLAVVAIGSALAGWRATEFLPSLNGEPVVVTAGDDMPPATARIARRVVLVILDGLRLDASRELPTLEALRRRGAEVPARAPFPSLSGPSYVEIATGIAPRYSGRRTNDHLAPGHFDSIFRRARDGGLRVASWTRDPTPLGLFAELEPAAALTDLATADLAVVAVMEIDRAGHRSGGDSTAYLDQVRATDATLSAIVATLDLARDAIIVCADHGHTDRGGHGGTSRVELDVPLVLAGAGIVASRVSAAPARLGSVAATAAALLGLSPPGPAPVLTEVLAVTPEGRARLAASDARRAAQFAVRAAAIDDDDAARLSAARSVRVPIVGIALVVAIGGLVRWRRSVALDRTAIAAAVTFVAVWAAALADPHVPGDRLSLWLEHARFGGLATAAFVVVGVLRARDRRRDPLVAPVAAAVAITGGLALAGWAIGGRDLASLASDPREVVITPVSYLAMAWLGIAVITLAAVHAALTRWPWRYARGGGAA